MIVLWTATGPVSARRTLDIPPPHTYLSVTISSWKLWLQFETIHRQRQKTERDEDNTSVHIFAGDFTTKRREETEHYFHVRRTYFLFYELRSFWSV